MFVAPRNVGSVERIFVDLAAELAFLPDEGFDWSVTTLKLLFQAVCRLRVAAVRQQASKSSKRPPCHSITLSKDALE